MQGLGYSKTRLGLNVNQHENGSISINQNGYIYRILARWINNTILITFPIFDSFLFKIPCAKRMNFLEGDGIRITAPIDFISFSGNAFDDLILRKECSLHLFRLH
jgi:hypothetical protein